MLNYSFITAFFFFAEFVRFDAEFYTLVRSSDSLHDSYNAKLASFENKTIKKQKHGAWLCVCFQCNKVSDVCDLFEDTFV